MDAPRRHREFRPQGIERMRRLSPAERLDLALGLTEMILDLETAGERSRAR